MQDDRQENSAPAPDETPAGSPLTRRQWFLRLGGTAVLAGFRGTPLDSAAAGLAVAADTGPALPPGLYDPSEDHMTHALTSDARFHPIPPGSETDFVKPPEGPFQPQFFSPSEYPLVRRLVELVLGQGNEGGEAQEVIAEVSEWIDLEARGSEAIREAARAVSTQHRTLITAYHGKDRIAEIAARDPAKVWREGLEWLFQESQRRWGTDFLRAPASAQGELLETLSDCPHSTENAGTQLFALLKREVIRGFYTSRRGLQELDYKGNTFNAECPGCNLVKPPSGGN